MKKLATVIFGASALIFSAVGNAAVFDFLALSNVAGAEKGGDPLVFMDGGVTLTATGSDGSGATYAYLDGGAGLGVCNTIDAGLQCDPSNDDNVTVGEVLKVVITGGNQIKDLSFLDANHDPVLAGGLVAYRIGGAGAFTQTTFGALSALSLLGDIFEFKIGGAVQSNANQFYISSLTAVPVPAAVWLFGTAMMGLLGLRRKSRMGAVAA